MEKQATSSPPDIGGGKVLVACFVNWEPVINVDMVTDISL